MATKDNTGLRFENQRSGTAGNAQIRAVSFAPGVAVAAGDAYRLMKIHAGMRIDEVKATIHTVAGAGTSMDVGWVEGERDASAAVAAANGDPDFFMDGVSLVNKASHESHAATFHKPLKVTKDGYLVAVFAAATAAGLDMTFHVEFEYVGSL